MCDWLEREKIAVDLLVNNAGLGDLGAFATSDPKRVDQMVLVNMLALTSLTRHLLPAMLEQRSGAILNVSSSASFLPLAGFAVYAATKAYVTSFSEGLRAELRGTGVTVTALCPGPVLTQVFSERRKDRTQGSRRLHLDLVMSRRRKSFVPDSTQSKRIRHRHPRFHHETGDGDGPHDANATAPRRFAFLCETDVEQSLVASTEQLYGRVFGVPTGLPASASSNAAFT